MPSNSCLLWNRAAEAAARAAFAAKEAIETGDAESAAEAAIECQQAAAAATQIAQTELMGALELKRKLIDLGATVETLSGGEPIDVMKHLGQRNGYTSVVWRAGCWGNRGVQSILAGAFQWVREYSITWLCFFIWNDWSHILHLRLSSLTGIGAHCCGRSWWQILATHACWAGGSGCLWSRK